MKIIYCAAALVTLGLPAIAADMPMPRFATIPVLPAEQAVPAGEGWYLRGDVGAYSLGNGKFQQQDLSQNGGRFIAQSLGSAGLVGVGIGYRINPWFRMDATLDHRTSAPMKAVDNLSVNHPTLGLKLGQFNTVYTGHYSATVGLINGYVDLGTWKGITPYVGAGVGVARYSMQGFTDTGFATTYTYGGVAPYPLLAANSSSNGGYAKDRVGYNLAWAVMAGAAFDITDRVKLDIGYRYVNLGPTSSTSLINCICGAVGNPLKIKNLDSHDIRIGIRWTPGETAPARSSPVVLSKSY